jgi:thioesterase domain-containing protein
MLDAYAFGVEKIGNASRRAKMTVKSAALRATFHVRNFFSQDLSGKLDYVRRKTHTIKRRVLWKLRSEQYKTYLRGADELPGAYNAVAHAMWAAMKRYSPAPYHGRMLVLRADDDAFMRNNDPTLGWGELVDPRPTVVKVPGAHLTFLEAPHVGAVATAIKAATGDDDFRTAYSQHLEVASLR